MCESTEMFLPNFGMMMKKSTIRSLVLSLERYMRLLIESVEYFIRLNFFTNKTWTDLL